MVEGEGLRSAGWVLNTNNPSVLVARVLDHVEPVGLAMLTGALSPLVKTSTILRRICWYSVFRMALFLLPQHFNQNGFFRLRA